MRAPSCHVAVEESGFGDRLIAVRAELTALWESCEREILEAGPPVGWLRKQSNARATRRLIDEFASELERLPRDEPSRAAWRDAVRSRLQQFGEQCLNWPDGYRRLLFGDQFYASAVDFVRDARAFDPDVRLADIGQALRNVWIGNSFQMLLDQPVALRSGLFGYSMLYPVTDNWLDDPTVTTRAKHVFNEWLARRLAGEPVRPRTRHEADVARLVEGIERDCPRDRCRALYQSLLAINDAQTASRPGRSTRSLPASRTSSTRCSCAASDSAIPCTPTGSTSSTATAWRCSSAASPISPRALPGASAGGSRAAGRCRSGRIAGCVAGR